MKGVSSSMTIRGALLLIVGFALQLATMLGYITPDEAATFNDKTAHLVGLGADIVGLGMVIVGRIRAGGLSLFGKTLGVVLLAITLGACATVPLSQTQQLLAYCQSYQAVERQVILLDLQGRLSADHVAAYKAVMPVARGICKKPSPDDPALDLRTALARIDQAILEMTVLKGAQ